jgi:hypothetical protein
MAIFCTGYPTKAFFGPEQGLSPPPPGSEPPGLEPPLCDNSGCPPLPWRLLGLSSRCKSGTSEGSSNRADPDDVSTSIGTIENEGSDNGQPEVGCMEDKIFRESNTIENQVSVGFDDEETHTLMIKHLPCRCSQQEVLNAIEDVGFGEAYDFFYLPIRRGHTQNFGYAFVGFNNKDTCSEFAQAIAGYRFAGRSSSKACAVAPARIQGFSGNVEHFEKTRCMRRKNRPILSMRA